jgi:hypothetical protein
MTSTVDVTRSSAPSAMSAARPARMYWRLTVRDADTEPDYLDTLTAMLVRAIGA